MNSSRYGLKISSSYDLLLPAQTCKLQIICFIYLSPGTLEEIFGARKILNYLNYKKLLEILYCT